jgi:hypothetical protein
MMAGLVCYEGRADVLCWQGWCAMKAGLVCYEGRDGMI